MEKISIDDAVQALRDRLGEGEALSPDIVVALQGMVAAAPPPDELEITPRKPIAVGELAFPVLKLREPTATEMEQVDKLEGTAYDITFISLVSGWPRPAVAKLGARDMLKAARFLGRFLA